MTLKNYLHYSRVVPFLVSASFISLCPVPGIKDCDDQWHRNSCLMVLLCTHWRCCPGDHVAARTAFLFSSRCWELLGEALPSGRLTGGFVSTGPPCCPCRALRGEQLSYQNTPGAEESWALGTVVFLAVLCGCASHPGVRPLNPHGGLGPFCLFAALCPVYWAGVRGLPWHSMWSSNRGLIPLNVDVATPTPELSRHPF